MEYKLIISYKDTKVTRKYYFDSAFSLFRFMYPRLKNEKVIDLKVVKL